MRILNVVKRCAITLVRLETKYIGAMIGFLRIGGHG